MSCVALSLLLFAACGDDDPAPATTPTTDVVDSDVVDSDVVDSDVVDSDVTEGDAPMDDTAMGDTAMSDVPMGPMSILETAMADENFSTLVAAVTAAGLVDTLSGDGPFTILAPTNAAFGGLDPALLEAAMADPDGLLKSVVLYHAIDGKVMATDVMGMTSATTLNGADISIEVVDGVVVLNGLVNVTGADMECTNGVIHVIDGVLLPPQPNLCQQYCGTVAANCTDGNALTWTDDCATDCAGWPEGEAGDTGANTTHCRLYHAGAAADDAALHCPHASADGGGVCVDPEPTVCEQYCDAVAANCTDMNALTWTADCATDCAGWPEGEAGDTGANTTHCRLYHAGVAADDAALHCPHASADGGGVCVDM
jgi:uncharacterized surface protein with fasciclin (FAS1) repeats